MLPNTQGRLPLKRASLRFPDNSEHRGACREVPQGFNGIPPNTIYLQFLTRGNRGEVGVKLGSMSYFTLHGHFTDIPSETHDWGASAPEYRVYDPQKVGSSNLGECGEI
jgi:hypothetical protein